jgi:hypothetical protein
MPIAALFRCVVFATALCALRFHWAAAQQATDAAWEKLIAAAKQEGEIVLIIPPSATHREFLAREWPKAFPGIELSQTSARAAIHAAERRAERRKISLGPRLHRLG